MAGIVKHVAAGMLAHTFQKHFEGLPIMQVLSRMNFKAKIHSGMDKSVQDGQPTLREFIESRFDKTHRPLRPGIDIGPRQRS